MFNSMAPSIADIAAVTDGNRNDGWGFGGGLWILVLLLFVAGGFGRGFGWGGFGGGNCGCGCDSACATVGDVQRGFDQQSTNQRFNAVDNAFAQLGYANQQNAYETRIAIANAQAAQQQCCCDTLRAIDGVNFNTSRELCNLGHSVADGFAQVGYNQAMNTNAVIQNAHADTDRVLAKLNDMETARLQERNHALEIENQTLKSNAFFNASQDAQTAEILRRTGNDCPTPAYVVQPPTPVTFATNCCGNAYGYTNSCGCGYNN